MMQSVILILTIKTLEEYFLNSLLKEIVNRLSSVNVCASDAHSLHSQLFIVQLLAFFPVEQQSEAFRAKSFCE